MRTYKRPIITGQQKIMLNKYTRGELKETDLYGLLSSRINEIPHRMVQKSTDKECILWLHKYAIVYTNVHRSINFFDRYKKEYGKTRLQNLLNLKK